MRIFQSQRPAPVEASTRPAAREMGLPRPLPLGSLSAFKAPIQRTKQHAADYIRHKGLPIALSKLNKTSLEEYLADPEQPIEHRMALVKHWNHEQRDEHKVSRPEDIRHVRVSDKVMHRLERGNKAILETTRQLPLGAGNNLFANQETHGLSQAYLLAQRGVNPFSGKDATLFKDQQRSPQYRDANLEEVSCDLATMGHFPGGNCGEHATATFANLYNATSGVPLKRKSLNMDHAYTQQGDSDVEDESSVVVSDAWLPKAQSVRKKDFIFRGEPGRTRFSMKSRRGEKVTARSSIGLTKKGRQIQKRLGLAKDFKYSDRGIYRNRYATRGDQRKIVYFTEEDAKDPARMRARRRQLDRYFQKRRAIYKAKVDELRGR